MIAKHWGTRNRQDYEHWWTHELDKDFSKEERKLWLENALESAGLDGSELVVRETENGYEFGFKRVEDWTMFVFRTFGDMESDKGHTHTHKFNNEVDPYFVKSAAAYLQAMDIDSDLQVENNQVQFAFDRFSERAAFQIMLESGEIDRMAERLYQKDKFFERLQVLAPDTNTPELLLDN